MDDWDSESQVQCEGNGASSGSARFILHFPTRWPLQLRLLLLRQEGGGHLTAFFEDVSTFYPTSFDDSLEWPWPPPSPLPPPSEGQGGNACGVLHLIDSTFSYGCAVANYSGCRVNSGGDGSVDINRGSCGSHVGMDDVMRFLRRQQETYVLVNDRCPQEQALNSSRDAQQQLRVWSGVDAPLPCDGLIKAAQSAFPPIVTLFTDYMVARVDQLRRLYPSDTVAVWLVEPRSICPSCYQYVNDHAEQFDIILSHDIQFLSDIRRRHPRGPSAAAFVPFASALMHPPLIGLHQQLKSQLVSCFVSNKRMLIGHVLRHGVYNHPHLRSHVHFYGQAAGQEIEHKTDAFAPYMFHIVIENSRARSYYSEKLIDCFLTGTIPLYWGGELPRAFNSLGVITWNTLDDLVDVVSSLSVDVYRSRLSAVIDNYNAAQSGPYTNTLQYAWNTYVLPLAKKRAKVLEDGLATATEQFEIASKKRSEESVAFVSAAADAVRAAINEPVKVKSLDGVRFWIVVYVDATMTIDRIERCLQLLQAQSHSSWHALVVVEHSAYILPEYRALLESVAKGFAASAHRVALWSSSDRCETQRDCILLALNSSSLAYDESIDPVCVVVQGRDSFSSSESLVRIAELYMHLNCWVTYGSSVLLPSMILEASRDAAADEHFLPASVYERNTARATEWHGGRPPFFTLLRSVLRQIPASHSRLPEDDGRDLSLALLLAAVELAGDRVVPSVHVVHERWISRNFRDAALGGSELLHVQAAWARSDRLRQLPPLRRLRGARMLPPSSSLTPNVSIAVKGGLLHPAGTKEVSVSVSASGIWVPEEATLRFLVDGEDIADTIHLNSFVFMMPTVIGSSWQLHAQLITVENGSNVIAEELVTLQLDEEDL